jgi:hypothetical protein
VVLGRAKQLASQREAKVVVASLAAPLVARNSAPLDEAIQLREQTKDLPRLRNEVTQLRVRKGEMDAARNERAKLMAAKQTGAPVPRETPPGFISKDRLTNAGFATPEDALQTFFWAMRDGNLALTIGALVSTNQERRNIERLSAEKRAELEQHFSNDREKMMDNFNDFAVRERETLSDDLVALHVGSSLSTNTMKIHLAREGAEWRLRDLPR